VYTDQVYDLLQTQDKLQEALPICEDGNVTPMSFHSSRLRKTFISKASLKKGFIPLMRSSKSCIMARVLFRRTLDMTIDNRHYAYTIMNHNSSRSHTIFRVHLHSRGINTKSRAEEVVDAQIVNLHLSPLISVELCGFGRK
jgi:centromeric protein E